MSIEITLRGTDPDAAADEAAALLREIGQPSPTDAHRNPIPTRSGIRRPASRSRR